MTGHFPATRLRRPRAHAWSRALFRENVLTPADLIWPLFVTEGQGVAEPIGTLPGVSRWSFSWGAEYNLPAKLLGKEGEVYLGYDGSYRSRYSSNPSPSAYTWIDGYSLHNLRAGFRVPHGFDISAWVRNATNRQYFELLTVTSGNTGLIAANLGDPRTFGGTIKVQF